MTTQAKQNGLGVAPGVPAGGLTGSNRQPGRALFDYDATQPLAVEEVDHRKSDGVTLQDITYAVNGERIKAYLLLPDGQGPFPAVLFLHWLGQHNNNRDEFLGEAKALAQQGVASLLVDGTAPWIVEPKNAQEDRRQVIQQVVVLRRGLDLLAARPEVDEQRLVLAGHDFGAMHGILLASCDARIKAGVLMTPVPTYAEWYLPYWLQLTGEAADQYRQTLADVDPITRIGKLTIPILMQFSTSDHWVPKEAATSLYDVARTAKEIRWYDAGHELSDEAQQDRMSWLLAHLAPAKQAPG